MSVVTEICNKVAIIENGRVVENGLVEEIFASPQTDAARELILEKQIRYTPIETMDEKRRIRIVFSENSAFEPVISNVILQFHAPINILKADTRNVNGKAKGEMILGLPEGTDLQENIISYLKERGLTVTEVSGHV